MIIFQRDNQDNRRNRFRGFILKREFGNAMKVCARFSRALGCGFVLRAVFKRLSARQRIPKVFKSKDGAPAGEMILSSQYKGDYPFHEDSIVRVKYGAFDVADPRALVVFFGDESLYFSVRGASVTGADLGYELCDEIGKFLCDMVDQGTFYTIVALEDSHVYRITLEASQAKADLCWDSSFSRNVRDAINDVCAVWAVSVIDVSLSCDEALVTRPGLD